MSPRRRSMSPRRSRCSRRSGKCCGGAALPPSTSPTTSRSSRSSLTALRCSERPPGGELGRRRSPADRPREPYTRSSSRPAGAGSPARSARAKPGAADPCADSVSASYRGMPDVLRDISFSLSPDETLAVVGTSGSGKSTLARLICGLLPPTRGNVALAGEDLPGNFIRRSSRAAPARADDLSAARHGPQPAPERRRIIGRVVYSTLVCDREAVNRRGVRASRHGGPTARVRRPPSLPTLRRTEAARRYRPCARCGA